jgi:hypothetical protein
MTSVVSHGYGRFGTLRASGHDPDRRYREPA